MPACGLPSAESTHPASMPTSTKRAVVQVLVQGAGGGIVGHIDVGPAIVIEVGGEHAETEVAVGLQDAGLRAHVGEGAVAVVVVEDVGVAVETGRSAGDHHAFVETRAGLRHRRGLQVHVDVVGDEEIELAVAIVIDEGAARAPARLLACDAGLLADVGEGAVAVVVVENVLAVVGDEQVVAAIVVVVADADALAPAASASARP